MSEKVKLSKDGSSIDFVQSESVPTSVKKFRQSPEIEGFYRFVFENDLQKEAYEILERIVAARKAKKALEKAQQKAEKQQAKAPAPAPAVTDESALVKVRNAVNLDKRAAVTDAMKTKASPEKAEAPKQGKAFEPSTKATAKMPLAKDKAGAAKAKSASPKKPAAKAAPSAPKKAVKKKR